MGWGNRSQREPHAFPSHWWDSQHCQNWCNGADSLLAQWLPVLARHLIPERRNEGQSWATTYRLVTKFRTSKNPHPDPKLLPAERDAGQTLSCQPSVHFQAPLLCCSHARANSSLALHASTLTKRAQEFQRNQHSLVVLPRFGTRLPTILVRAGQIPGELCQLTALGLMGWECP